MKGLQLFALMLFSISSFPTAQTAKQYIGEISGQISVDAEGKVIAVNLPNIKESKLKIFMYKQISTWKFSPMKVNGKPVQSNNDFGFELIIHYDKAKNLNQISFDNVFVSPSKLELEQRAGYKDTSKRVLPRYPNEALRQGLEASLDIAVKIAPDGSISEVGIYKMKLLNPNPGIRDEDQSFALNLFGKSAMKAVKQWKFSREALQLNECSNGCISQISVTYNLANGDVTYNLDNIQLKLYQEIPVAALPWFETNKVKKIQDKPESQFVRLKSEVSEQRIDIGG